MLLSHKTYRTAPGLTGAVFVIGFNGYQILASRAVSAAVVAAVPDNIAAAS